MTESFTDGGDEVLGYRITATGRLGMLNILREAGHDVETCDCALCPKVRGWVAKIYYARCAFCGEHTEAPYIKNNDLLHCMGCHRKRCSPRARPCEGGPAGMQMTSGPELGESTPFDPEPFHRMRGWPGTPSVERLQNALAHLEGQSLSSASQVLADVDRLQRADYLHRWGERISKNAVALAAKMDEGDPLRMEGFLGDTEDTIGMVIYTDYAEKRGSITRLIRNLEWIGVNPALERINGMHVQIIDSHHRPNKPALVSARQEPWPAEEAEAHFPAGEAEALRQIILWHGADQCQWHTLE